jgi:transketolase
LEHTRLARVRGGRANAEWQGQLAAWRTAHPQGSELLDRLQAKAAPQGWLDALPTFPAGAAVATRAASGKVLTAIGQIRPELWGGSADLGPSNNTTMEGAADFLPGHPEGRTIHFGVREQAMAAGLNGIALHGLTLPYGGEFMVFSDYMRGSIRLTALMGLPVTYVLTHDSLGVGEDGPTHQPVEHLAALRAIPGLDVIRPADANEVSWAWATILERRRPAALALSRQNLPVFDRQGQGLAAANQVARGAYCLADSPLASTDVLLLATGSEVQLALGAREALAKAEVGARVVSVPCLEWFAEQDSEYQELVLPSNVKARVAIEAGIAMPWWRLVGDAGQCVSVEDYGESAAGPELMASRGFTVESVVAAAQRSLALARE